jgi:hypothetical protein
MPVPVEKLLEDACIKLSAVVADIFGVSGRDMLAVLAAGERDPKALAQLARRSMRGKIAVLEKAFTGHFTSHHAFLLRTMPRRVDAIRLTSPSSISASPRRPPRLPARPPGSMRSPGSTWPARM